jgi:hypothetical protein
MKSDLQVASGGSEPEKRGQHEVVQHRLERSGWILSQRIA